MLLGHACYSETHRAISLGLVLFSGSPTTSSQGADSEIDCQGQIAYLLVFKYHVYITFANYITRDKRITDTHNNRVQQNTCHIILSG